jgi:hypothetical protein
VQAWAKHHGCYETVESGQTDDAMAYLTGSHCPSGSRTPAPMVGPVPSVHRLCSRTHGSERGRATLAAAAQALPRLPAPWQGLGCGAMDAPAVAGVRSVSHLGV